MLLINRRIGQTVNIGEDITVTILGVNDKEIRLGIKAPKDIKIFREEIFHKVKIERALQQDLKAHCTCDGSDMFHCPVHHGDRRR